MMCRDVNIAGLECFQRTLLMEHKIDRLSELPEPIVEHILSFIPLKQILQLTILSKRWQNVWTLFPIPEINQRVICSNLYSKNKRREETNYFVERTLLSRYRQELSLKKFELTMHIDESYCALVNRWIEYAIESNVKELNLSSVCQPKFSQVPKSVLVANQ